MGNRHHKQKLSEENIRFLVNHTQFTRHEIIEWHRKFIKDFPSGKLDKKEFRKVYKAFYFCGDPEIFCENVFRVFDQDGNNQIDFNEFLLAVSITSKNTDLNLKLQWIFKIYDIDGNGVIEKKELKLIVTSIYKLLYNDSFENNHLQQFAEEHANEIFKRFDTDDDKYISLEEFINGCKSDPNLLKLLCPSI